MYKYSVEYTPGSDLDIIEIYDYIYYTLKNPLSAEKIITKIRQKCNSLAVYPRGYAVRLSSNGLDFRFAHISSYTIVYHIDNDSRKVFIDYIIYSHRDIAKLIK